MRIITIFLSFILIISSAYSAGEKTKVEEYVNHLVSAASNLLSDSAITEEQKVKKSRELISQNLDLHWMAGYTLGRHRKELSKEQIKEYMKIYSTYVINTYSELVRNYKGEKAVVKTVSSLNNKEYIVHTELIKNDQPPIKIDYLVRDISKNNEIDLKVSDVITEGISMINSQKAEFNSILNQSQFNGLINELKKKL